MMILQRFACLFALAVTAGQLLAAETARVSKPRILVRAQPTIYSEILSKLEQGDQVVILEEVTREQPREGEPAEWLKIKMPENVPVWVFSPYLNADHSVKVSRLNLRAGPGENYSVVGRIERGAVVKPIRAVEEWTEIETPEGAYGFIAADLVESSGSQAPPARTAPERVSGPPPVTAQPQTRVEPNLEPQVTRVEPQEPPAVARDVDRPAREQPAQPQQPVDLGATPPPAREQQPPVSAQPTVRAPVEQPPAAPLAAETEQARVVRREGIVRSTKNPLAPTYEELVSAETRKTINFLWTGPNGMDLKPFRGKRVVVVGEEGLDPKWPRTPVIEVQTIEPAPDVSSESN